MNYRMRKEKEQILLEHQGKLSSFNEACVAPAHGWLTKVGLSCKIALSIQPWKFEATPSNFTEYFCLLV